MFWSTTRAAIVEAVNDRICQNLASEEIAIRSIGRDIYAVHLVADPSFAWVATLTKTCVTLTPSPKGAA